MSTIQNKKRVGGILFFFITLTLENTLSNILYVYEENIVGIDVDASRVLVSHGRIVCSVAKIQGAKEKVGAL